MPADHRSSRAGRRPGGPDTRGQILIAARSAFAARGFAGATVRGIAADAGVDAALVHHYFDTKQQLFLAALHIPVPLPQLIGEAARGGLPGLGDRLITVVLSIWESEHQPLLVAAMRATLTEPELTRSMQEFLTREVLERLLRVLDVPRAEAERRAGLAAAQLVGLYVGRYLVELPYLTSQTAAELRAAIGPVLQDYLEGRFGR